MLTGAGVRFADLLARFDWRPIRNCPGRWSLSPARFSGPPAALAGPASETFELPGASSADPVLITRFADGGLISYRKPGGSFLHTLNTPEGLERKLLDLTPREPGESR